MRRGVLVVDDDPFTRRLVAVTLQDVSGFELHQAQDGVEAVQVAERVQPAVVFLDVDMPRMDGIDACRQIRESGGAEPPLIVILTAAHGESTEARARDAGADLFLTKPFSPLELLRLVDGLSV